jgi:conjugative relaxase-like TrwC/TraI family protein
VTMVTPRSGYDLEYYLNRAGEKTAGGYYLNAAQEGEPPGRWFGQGAEALGFADGQQVERDPYLAVYQQTDPVTGEKLGRAPNGWKRFGQVFAAKLAAEPHATWERRLELEREAGQQARRSPVYTDFTVAHNKSISVLHASFREQARRAHLAGDAAREALWRRREERVQEILQEANHAALEELQRRAGFVRTGYHGRRVDGREPGRWEAAGLVVTSWLQHTSRDGEPHDHIHNVIARMARTENDGLWRAVDTMALRAQLGAFGAIQEVRVKAALAREFGVRWVAREDGAGHEIEGIAQETLDAFSTRAHVVTQAQVRLARAWERKHGRAPNAGEMQYLGLKANKVTRKGKEGRSTGTS